MSYRGASRFSSAGAAPAVGKKRQDTRDYFDDEDDEEPPPPAAPPSSGTVGDDDVDPLDQFMAGVDSQMHTQRAEEKTAPPEIVSGQERDYEGYFDMMDKQAKADADAAEVEYDSDGVPVGLRGASDKKPIDPLPPVDHASIAYPAFRKDLYRVHPMTAALSHEESACLFDAHDIHVMGTNVPLPIRDFNQAGFNAQLLREVARHGYDAPTAIQMQALPVALSGRDLIGLAKTGSGKTLSFVWPMIVHALDQPQMQIGDGPIGLVLAPTRELVTQTYAEANKFCKIFNMRVCAVYGGEGKWEQTRALKEAPEIVVATPGRFIDFASAGATNLRRCTMVVLDEADRMFEMGFEYQMRSIVNNIRPDRQTLLFSATMKKKIEGFAREILRDPVRIVIGSIGASNKDIQQVIDVVDSPTQKWPWLTTRIDDWVAEGKVLIFVGSKSDTDKLTDSLKTFFQHRRLAVGVDCLHGDKTQTDRSNILRRFKSGELTVLVATDVASRGLDIKDIRTVVNYDCAKNIDTHVHRIGRTGRLGVDGVTPGTAFTILVSGKTPSPDSSLAVDLVKNMREAEQEISISASLMHLAEADPRWGGQKNKIASSKNGGRFASNDKGGLGSSGVGVAMTSAMLASASSVRNAAAPGDTDFAANKYIPGHSMGRGKHLTQPSWMADAPLETGNPAPRNSSENGALSCTNGVCSLPIAVPEAPLPSAPALPGFVRASQTHLSSVTPILQQYQSTSNVFQGSNSINSSAAASVEPRKKKSRWDT